MGLPMRLNGVEGTPKKTKKITCPFCGERVSPQRKNEKEICPVCGKDIKKKKSY